MSNNNSDKGNSIEKSFPNSGTIVGEHMLVNEEDTNKEGSSLYIKNLDCELEKLFKTHDLEVDGKLKNLDNNTARKQEANKVKALEGNIDNYLNKLQNCNRDAIFDKNNNNQENISINNNIQNEFDIDKVKNPSNRNNEEIKKINDKNFSNIYLKAKYNNTDLKAKYNRFNTYPKAKYSQFEDHFNDLLEHKPSVNYNADKKDSSRHSNTVIGYVFDYFRNCFDC